MASSIPTIALRTGASIPLLGYGVGTAWGQPSSSTLNQTLVNAIKSAISHGYFHLDCAEVYGTEKEVGAAIKESHVPREKLWVTHKIYRTLNDPQKCLTSALKAMDLSYVDLYLLHAPFFSKETHGATLEDVWTALESLQQQGLAKYIGVSNFQISDLQELFKFAKIPPVVNQIEFNPYCTDWELLKFCKDNNIQVCAYSPLAPLNKFPGGPLDAVVKDIAEKKGLTEAQVLLKWVLQNGVVPITTSSKDDRLTNYKDLWGWELTLDEMEAIKNTGAKAHHRIYWVNQLKQRGME